MSNENRSDRRRVLIAGANFIAGAIGVSFLLRTSPAKAAAGRGESYAMNSTTEGKCATCAFWGGIRRLSDDRQTVLTQSLGWCNNPDSKRYGQLTTPETGPMKSWRKWQLIP
jgi:hypothetical protein